LGNNQPLLGNNQPVFENVPHILTFLTQTMMYRAFPAKTLGCEGHFDVRQKQNTPRVTKITFGVSKFLFGVFEITSGELALS